MNNILKTVDATTRRNIVIAILQYAASEVAKDEDVYICDAMADHGLLGRACTKLLGEHFGDRKFGGYHSQYIGIDDPLEAQEARLFTLCFMIHLLETGEVKI